MTFVTAKGAAKLYLCIKSNHPETFRFMRKRKEVVAAMIALIEKLIERAQKAEKYHAATLKAIHPTYLKSARNLIHYRALRTQDISNFKKSWEKWASPASPKQKAT
jgi:hypothetical protein